MKENKVKKWFMENKEEIKKETMKIVYFVAGYGIGCFVMNKLTSASFGAVICKFYGDGVIKFFDPSTNVELGIDQAVKVIEKLYE